LAIDCADGAAVAVGGVVGGRPEIREAGWLNAGAGHRFERGFDQDARLVFESLEIDGHGYSRV
jgi:hypothetical protein